MSATRVSLPRSWWSVVRFVAGRTFLDPVRRGRITERPEDPWPRALRPVVFVATLLYAGLAVLALVGIRMRSWMPVVGNGTLSLPVPVVTFIIAGAVLGSSLWFLGACHWRHPVRYLVMLPTVGMTVGAAVYNPIALAILVVFALLMIVRRRRRLAAWELPLVVALSSFSLWTILGRASDPLAVLTEWLTPTALLIAPSMLGAGAAIAEISVGAASWTMRGFWEASGGRRRTPGLVLLIGVVVWTVIDAGLVIGEFSEPARWVSSFLLVFLVGVAMLVIGWLVPQGLRPGVAVDADDISRAWPSTSRTLVFGYTGAIVGTIPLGFLVGEGWGTLSAWRLGFLCLGVVFLVSAVVVARRGHEVKSALLAAFGMGTLVINVSIAVGRAWVLDAVPLSVDLLALCVLVWLLIRRRWTSDRLLAIGTVLLLGRFFGLRDLFDEPFTHVLGLSGAAVALAVGLIWRQLTEYEYTQRGSDRFPVDTRVLIGLGNMILVGVIIVMGGVGGAASGIDVDTYESLGDREIGLFLYLCAAMASLLLAWRGREGGDQRPGAEYRVGPHPHTPAPVQPPASPPDGRMR